MMETGVRYCLFRFMGERWLNRRATALTFLGCIVKARRERLSFLWKFSYQAYSPDSVICRGEEYRPDA